MKKHDKHETRHKPNDKRKKQFACQRVIETAVEPSSLSTIDQYLSNSAIPVAQRQEMAIKIGQIQGNRHLQRIIGNKAVLRLLQTATENIDSSADSPTVRPRPQQSGAELRLTERGSAYKEQAERVADQVVAMPIPIPQHSNPQDRTSPSSRTAVERAPSFMNRRGRGYLAQIGEPYVRTPDKTQRIPTALKDGIAALRSGGQCQQNVISLSWDDPAGPEWVRFRALERSLSEHGFRFAEDGENFRVTLPPIVAQHLGIYDLIPPPQQIHRAVILSTMTEWLPLVIRLEQQSALAGAVPGRAAAVQGPNIVDILGAAFASRLSGLAVDIQRAASALGLSSSPRQPLWVMDADDTYTRRVRLWGAVTDQLAVVKQHLEQNCEEWTSGHRTSPGWTPSATYYPQVDPHAWDDPSQTNPEGGRWGLSPSGTGAEVNASAYYEYLTSGSVPDRLWTSAIGSFGLYVTVDSIDCESGSAVLNVWMYNNMDQDSFGDPESWFSAAGLAMLWSGGVDPQYMWWHWTEPHHWAPRAPE